MTRHGVAGVVTSLSESTIVMEIPENVSFAVQAGPSTRIVSAGQAAALSDIHPGDPILANGDIDEQARTIQALSITIQPPFAAQMFPHPSREFWQKPGLPASSPPFRATPSPWQRRDGQSQTFTVERRPRPGACTISREPPP
jgi:hypothetical protein